MSEELRAREVLARHIRPLNKNGAWNILEAKDDAYWGPTLDAMLSFASSAAGQREGWKVVPVEPTPEMLAAGLCYTGVVQSPVSHIWSAMLAASPSAPEERRDEVEGVAPCPFCGDADIIEQPFVADGLNAMRPLGTRYMHCDTCGADGPGHDYIADARRAWNARAALTPVPRER